MNQRQHSMSKLLQRGLRDVCQKAYCMGCFSVQGRVSRRQREKKKQNRKGRKETKETCVFYFSIEFYRRWISVLLLSYGLDVLKEEIVSALSARLCHIVDCHVIESVRPFEILPEKFTIKQPVLQRRLCAQMHRQVEVSDLSRIH